MVALPQHSGSDHLLHGSPPQPQPDAPYHADQKGRICLLCGHQGTGHAPAWQNNTRRSHHDDSNNDNNNNGVWTLGSDMAVPTALSYSLLLMEQPHWISTLPWILRNCVSQADLVGNIHCWRVEKAQFFLFCRAKGACVSFQGCNGTCGILKNRNKMGHNEMTILTSSK